MCIHVLNVNWLLYTSIYISIYSIRIVVIPLSVHRHKNIYIYIYTDICIYCAYIYICIHADTWFLQVIKHVGL